MFYSIEQKQSSKMDGRTLAKFQILSRTGTKIGLPLFYKLYLVVDKCSTQREPSLLLFYYTLGKRVSVEQTCSSAG